MILLHIAHEPVDLRGREQQEILATLAAFGLPLQIVFSGAGAKLLDKRRPGESELLAMLPAFGISEVLLHEDALACSDLDPKHCHVPCRVVSSAELRELAHAARHALVL